MKKTFAAILLTIQIIDTCIGLLIAVIIIPFYGLKWFLFGMKK